MKMELTEVTITLSCLIMAFTLLPNLTNAQNTPKDFLDAHNPARTEVGVPPLAWNNTVAAYAQAYAAKRAENCALEHSQGPYGENIAEGSWDMSAKEAVGMWVGEKNNYDYDSNSCVRDQCLHYTQVVWRATKSVGCGKALCRNGWTFVSCNYDPPGNYIGERPY